MTALSALLLATAFSSSRTPGGCSGPSPCVRRRRPVRRRARCTLCGDAGAITLAYDAADVLSLAVLFAGLLLKPPLAPASGASVKTWRSGS